MPTPGKYALLKGKLADLVAAMTISPEYAWRTLSSQYEIPDPNLPPTHHMLAKARMDSDVTPDRVLRDTTQLPNHEICITLTHPLIMTVLSPTR